MISNESSDGNCDNTSEINDAQKYYKSHMQIRTKHIIPSTKLSQKVKVYIFFLHCIQVSLKLPFLISL